uniref:GB1/RHD3-type G domain-containing protein n=1 Tax=Leptobrachium leishanense TaxID=445787 RepID=A0A8C5PYR6_9ANUR
MSRQALMSDPVCLIENDAANQLVINKEALQILTSITEPLVVVAIVGKYRTGKSYLMNNLAGCKKGFPLGSCIQSKTKGIWMWCVPHPLKVGHVLVLLDTEGLGDVEKGDSKNDAWIFCLAVLLSSNLVFNSLGTIDQQAMEQLHYVTELTKRIRLQASQKDGLNILECKRVFPSFTWCVRDFTLDLIYDGKEITEDEYLMISLKCKEGTIYKTPSREPHYNLPRRCILQYFHSHKCFTFATPASSKKLRNLENLTNDELDPDFVAQSESFCSYFFKSGSVKNLPGAIAVNGRMLGSLAVSYVEAIKSGAVPCMENAVVALAESENTQAVKDAVTKYEAEMNSHVKKFPTQTELEFFQLHLECEKMAVKLFLARSFKDDKQKHQCDLKKLDRAKERFSKMNEDASIRFCEKLLDELGQTLRKNISGNYYSKPGGHKMFLEEKMKIMETYDRKPGRGIKVLTNSFSCFSRSLNNPDSLLKAGVNFLQTHLMLCPPNPPPPKNCILTPHLAGRVARFGPFSHRESSETGETALMPGEEACAELTAGMHRSPIDSRDQHMAVGSRYQVALLFVPGSGTKKSTYPRICTVKRRQQEKCTGTDFLACRLHFTGNNGPVSIMSMEVLCLHQLWLGLHHTLSHAMLPHDTLYICNKLLKKKNKTIYPQSPFISSYSKALKTQQEFLASIKDIEITIRNADQSLTEKEKEVAGKGAGSSNFKKKYKVGVYGAD